MAIMACSAWRISQIRLRSSSVHGAAERLNATGAPGTAQSMTCCHEIQCKLLTCCLHAMPDMLTRLRVASTRMQRVGCALLRRGLSTALTSGPNPLSNMVSASSSTITWSQVTVPHQSACNELSRHVMPAHWRPCVGCWTSNRTALCSQSMRQRTQVTPGTCWIHHSMQQACAVAEV